jgi:ATP-dependent 26S proteasome regulatory subunit
VDASRFKSLLACGYSAIRIVSMEEPEVRALLRDAASDLHMDHWEWSATTGLRHIELAGVQEIPDTMNPAAAMTWLAARLARPSMVVMLDLADHLSDPRVLRATVELAEYFRMGPEAGDATGRKVLVLVDHRDEIPPSLGFLTARYDIPPPSDDELEDIIRRAIVRQQKIAPVSATVKRSELHSIVENLRGLTRRHADQVITQVIADDRVFSIEDLPRIIDAKRRLLADSGVLDFVDAPATLDQIGGLNRLKAWLSDREKSFSEDARKMGIDPPKGLLLLGVQGSGKSLAARAIATAWRRPLMRLDPGALYDRYIGESESRLRSALRQAEGMSPVILWVDEIEKGFAGAAGQSVDGGLSRRMFGTLLTWMQEHTAPVFTVATANDIEALPPELLRKGRFDETFFVDLPGEPARRDIFRIHLKRRNQDPAAFDVAALAAAANGFSGAEIEAAVLAAFHRALSTGGAVDTALILDAIKTSPPLSVTMREKVAELRAWARGRCVPAD